MTNLETKKMIVGAIRKLEGKLVDLRYSYNPDQTLAERDEEIECLQRHLRSAHGTLVLLTEEELAEAA